MSEVTFTRNNDYQATHLSRAQAPGWAIEVWRDKRKQPISFYRHASCRIPDDCIDKNRYPLFMARSVLRELIESLPSTRSL